MTSIDFSYARTQFPALQQKVEGKTPIFLDGPGGAQVPKSVAEAMGDYLTHYNSNLFNSPFFAVQKTHEVVAQARQNAAIFVNAPAPENIVFGATMSSLTAHLSRSISKEWQAGDEIIVTALDHYSNVSFWQQAAQDRGVTCHQLRINPEDCTLDVEHLESLLSSKTRLVAFTLASNVTGSYTDAKQIIELAKQAGAMTYLDSVHAAPHRLPDVKALDCDFLLCSVYKFGGPHMAFAFGKSEHLQRLTPYKVAPAPDTAPDCWEMGTKSFEALAGFNALMEYYTHFVPSENMRSSLLSYYDALQSYEIELSREFLHCSNSIKGMRIYGITEQGRVSQRTPTFAFTIEGHTPQEVSDFLANACIATGSGHFYAQGVVDALGLSDSGGFVRAGFLHYNTQEELHQLFVQLDKL